MWLAGVQCVYGGGLQECNGQPRVVRSEAAHRDFAFPLIGEHNTSHGAEEKEGDETHC